ncbi:MAG: hypothetical protein ABEH78_08025 [Haloferacaceae archaeon]
MVCGDPADGIDARLRTPVCRAHAGLGSSTADADTVERLLCDGGTVQACPECESSDISPRNPGHHGSTPDVTAQWYCIDCAARFSEPAEREPIHAGQEGGRNSSAYVAAALDADPELIPDGGVDTDTPALAPVVEEPAPKEAARHLDGLAGVLAAYQPAEPADTVEVVLPANTPAVPPAVVRALYRRRLFITDVSPRGDPPYLMVLARPEEVRL